MLKQFNKPYNPKEVEEKIYRLWEKSGYFAPEAHQPQAGNPNSKKTFSIVIPPPNVTGSLHMGHALNAVIQDILIRQKRMEGYKTLWLPGTDHAGIATQNIVEKELRKQGLTRHDLGKEKFIEKVWAWKEKYGNIILDQLKKLGSSCDWSRRRFTMDKNYIEAVEATFLHYYKKGWIYQGDRVVNWCKRCQTSLSDLEIEYEEEKGKLWYIKYKIKNQKSKIKNIVVATTRPETMLGDTAVAVNPRDKRYKNLIGKIAILPIMNREIPIIADSAVEMGFGTGAVKVTPAHDMLDFEISERHKLPVYQVINQFGKMTREAGEEYKGLSTKDAREKIVVVLEKQGLIEKIEDYNLRISKCYRCNSVIEPQISKQWFLKMDELAKMAIKAVKSGKVKFHPKRWEKVYFNWLRNIKDWCISRQIWWGHRLPVWRCQTRKNPKSKILNPKQPDERYFIFPRKPSRCLICKVCQPKQLDDVLDTWFSSALWPFAVFGWPDKKSKDLKEFYPTQVLSTARDIINLWVARMIFSSIELLGKKPFSDMIIHPTILTKDGKRMSKSLGTGIDPMDLIEKYGADATRFGLIYQMMGSQDIHFSEDAIMAGKKFANKLWNIARFVLQNADSKISAEGGSASGGKIQNSKLQIKTQNLTNQDKEILKKLEHTVKSVNKDIEKYNIGQALHSIYDFVWHDFADIYIEYSKTNKSKETLLTLNFSLLTILKLLHPFMPFITEEIWRHLPIKDKKLLMVENWRF